MHQAPLNFFASAADLARVLEPIERKTPLRYVALENERDSTLSAWAHVRDIPDVMVARNGGVGRVIFLFATDEKPVARPRDHASGDRWYSLHPKDVNSAVILQHGGAYQDGFVAARVFMTGDDPATQALNKAIRRGISKAFTKVRSYHVGPDAFAALEDGKRLAGSWSLPRNLDLRF